MEAEHVPGGRESEDGFHSSYLRVDLTFGDILRAITISQNPKKVVEYGILDGFSLHIFAQEASKDCKLYGYDLFEKFVGNGSRHEVLTKRFGKMENVVIEERDFYESPQFLEDGSVDILHVDIANNGDVYQFAVEKLVPKLSPNGILLLEGGTEMRDQVPWMLRYNKRPMNPYVTSLMDSDTLKVKLFGSFPGITMIRRK